MQTMEREKERWQIVTALSLQFIQRKDIHAVQLPDGRYVSVRQPFTPDLMYRHLEGKLTLGGYLLDQQNLTRQMVLDADDQGRFDQLKQLARALTGQGIPAYLETSRRGGHLRLFFAEPVSGQKARRLGLKLLHDHHLLKMEIYPKQEMVGDGPGSLMRIPFGRHRLTGKRYGFIYPDGSPLGTLKQQVEQLTRPDVVPVSFVEANQYQPERKQPTVIPAHSGSGETTWERIKTSMTVYEFVSQYVELKHTGSGYVGLCPFHEDRHPSFGVNTAGNYWNCFAGCGGGSIIDFWMLFKDVDFKTAVSELEDLLLGNGSPQS